LKRAQLEHLIRAAAANAGVRDIIVIGSQAILASHPAVPEELTRSMEADVFAKEDPTKSTVIDGAIGELSIFHQTFGYYAHGVDQGTATLPAGWRERLIPIENENTGGAVGWCLDPNDLAVSKLAAGREKDVEFVRALFRHQLASKEIVRQRFGSTSFASSEAKSLALGRLNA
jgi:hypothetical protein